MTTHQKMSPFNRLNRCVNCNFIFSIDALEVSTRLSNAQMLAYLVTCPHCHLTFLSSLAVSPYGMSAVGFLTDLTKKDIALLISNKQINEDHVINLYSHLNS
jgi:hypothetical protein